MTKEKPTTLLLVRHATNEWVKTGRLAGRTPGVHLNQHGQLQAQALADRLASLPIRAVYASPLERAQETAAPIAQAHNLAVVTSSGIGEADFGDWTGRDLKELAKEPGWQTIQQRPSTMRFPAGESVRAMQERAIQAVEQLAHAHRGQMLVLVSHADVIKALAAHFLGLHLDLFQRLVIAPASLTILSFAADHGGGQLITLNDMAHLPRMPKDDE